MIVHTHVLDWECVVMEYALCGGLAAELKLVLSHSRVSQNDTLPASDMSACCPHTSDAREKWPVS